MIDHSSNIQLAGLFGGLSGTVKNLGLVGGSVTATQASAGFLAAVVNVGGTVANSYATGSVQGDRAVGGLVGTNLGTITQAYAQGDVATTSTFSGAGGLAGESYGVVDETYASGRVQAPLDNPYQGGLVGRFTGTITDSYFDVTVNSAAALTNGAGAPRTTAQLQSGDFDDLPGFATDTWDLQHGRYPEFGRTNYLSFSGTVTGAGAGIPLSLWINGAKAATTP